MKTEYEIIPEFAPQKAVWIQWPTSAIKEGVKESDFIPAFIEIERACRDQGEVHNIVLNEQTEKDAKNTIVNAGIPIDNLFFHVMPYDSCWSRDNGPIFVRKNGNEHILDFGFNSWGYDPWGPFEKDDEIPQLIAKLLDIGITKVQYNELTNGNGIRDFIYEGGTLEFSGEGTIVASWAICKHRNPKLDKKQATEILANVTGSHTVIWIDSIFAGTTPAKADNHTDGYMKFYEMSKVCVLDSRADEPGKEAANKLANEGWDIYHLPPDFRWTLVNCLLFNRKVIAGYVDFSMTDFEKEIMEDLFPEKEIIEIEIGPMVRGGGGIHCVTQQQPK